MCAAPPRRRPPPALPPPTPTRPSWSPPRKQPPASTRLAILAALSLLLLGALVGFTLRTHLPFNLPPSLPDPPTLCLSTSSPWRFNTRALCLISSVCLPVHAPASALLRPAAYNRTVCRLATPAWHSPHTHPAPSPDPHVPSCRALERDKVLCAHGPGLEEDKPTCPSRLVAPAPAVLAQAEWIEDLTVLVPAYPWPENIFHFSNVIAGIAAVVHALPALVEAWGPHNLRSSDPQAPYLGSRRPRVRKVNILFRGRLRLIHQNIWQTDLLNVTLSHVLPAAGVEVSARWLTPEPDQHPLPDGADPDQAEHICLRNAVVMGRRGDINVFPFANDSNVPLDGRSVPWDAVLFKRAIYKAYDIPARLPAPGAKTGLSELPPLVLGYAKRAGERSKLGGNVLAEGVFRRFSPEDEDWFQDMLREETSKSGVGLHIFTTTAEEPLREQVRNIAQFGFVVGIHGANLVNALFMHPFGALFEIAPATRNFSPCYIGGMNSGLAYMRHESSQMATAEESGCTQKDTVCQEVDRYRMVKLGATVDRERVRQLIQDGIKRLKNLHATYPRGIPVVYDPDEARYVIKEQR